MSESMNRKQNEGRSNAGRCLHLREVSSENIDYDGIGADMRAGRVRLGKDLVDLASILRIRREHLEAVEQGRFVDLPAPVYAVGFVRTYAEYVGLNGEDAIRRFKEESEGLTQQTALTFPTPEEESRVPKGWLLALAAIAAVMVYAGWYYAENKDRLNLAEVPAVPERLADKTTEPLQAPQPRLQVPAPAPASSSEATPASISEPVETTSATAVSEEPRSAADEASAGETSGAVVTDQPTEVPATSDAVAETIDAVTPAPELVVVANVENVVEPITASTTEPALEPVAAVTPVEDTTTAVVQLKPVAVQPVVVQPTAVQPVAEAEPAPAEVTPATEPEQVIKPVAKVEPVVEKVEETVVRQEAPTIVQPVVPTSAEPPVAVAVVEREKTLPVTPDTVSTEPTPVVETLAPAVQQAGTEIPAASSEPGRQTQKFGTLQDNSRVEIYARIDVWVQVVSEDGQSLLSRILRQGDSYYAPADQVSFLTTGNAGALHILVDGKLIPPVGPPGAVRRDISLQPDSLLRIGGAPMSSNDN